MILYIDVAKSSRQQMYGTFLALVFLLSFPLKTHNIAGPEHRSQNKTNPQLMK